MRTPWTPLLDSSLESRYSSSETTDCVACVFRVRHFHSLLGLFPLPLLLSRNCPQIVLCIGNKIYCHHPILVFSNESGYCKKRFQSLCLSRSGRGCQTDLCARFGPFLLYALRVVFMFLSCLEKKRYYLVTQKIFTSVSMNNDYWNTATAHSCFVLKQEFCSCFRDRIFYNPLLTL